MALGSFAHDALIDLDLEALDRLLELDETLFVEHKTDIGKNDAMQIVKAVTSFANTVGGWLLIGVQNGAPTASDAAWAQDGVPTLVDVVRDRLRGEVDPLPAFEAKVIAHPQGPVGVIRVYESSDTPHVAIRSGAVYVREVAGVANAADPGKPGSGKHGQRKYEAAQIRSRAQLVELAARGQSTKERVERLLDPTAPLPLVADALPLKLEPTELGFQPVAFEAPAVIARIAPYTLTPRFRGWAMTSHSAAAIREAAESLADCHGLDNSWAKPDPSGASIEVPVAQGRFYAENDDLGGVASVVVDGAGIAGAGLTLKAPNEGWESWIRLDAFAERFIEPVVLAAAGVLERGEFLGRALCQIDLLRVSQALLLEGGGNAKAHAWVPVGGELVLPLDERQVTALSLRVANAVARSAGIPAWD
ncbi:MAG: AlbA family DNA-binding domain-containing protein [Solirubrobacterales bacterium]